MGPVVLIYIGLALLIPLGIIIGGWTPGGPMAVTSGIALLAFAVFWVITTQMLYASAPGDPQRVTLIIAMYASGFILTLAAWIIALADMARARRWDRVMLVLLAGVATIAATYGLLSSYYLTCAISLSQYVCASDSRVKLWLIVAGTLAGPAILLAHALRDVPRARPDGLSASRLDATQTEPL